MVPISILTDFYRVDCGGFSNDYLEETSAKFSKVTVFNSNKPWTVKPLFRIICRALSTSKSPVKITEALYIRDSLDRNHQ